MTNKKQIIERIITSYSGKTFNSSKEALEYLEKLIDAELTGYFSKTEKIKQMVKNSFDVNSVGILHKISEILSDN